MGGNVSGCFSNNDRELALAEFTQPHGTRHGHCLPSRVTNLAGIGGRNGNNDVRTIHHFHRVTVTVVPSPGAVLISNSFISLLLPPSPSPMPCLVVNPSVSACLTSAIPGPLSEKQRRIPLRLPSITSAISSSPPP